MEDLPRSSNGFSNNSYRGYETLQEAEEEYHSFLADQAMAVQAMANQALADHAMAVHAMPDQPMAEHAMAVQAMRIGEGAPHIGESRLKDLIIVFLIAVVVKVVF